MIGNLRPNKRVQATLDHWVGRSDGGIIGLLVAIARPDLVRKFMENEK